MRAGKYLRKNELGKNYRNVKKMRTGKLYFIKYKRHFIMLFLYFSTFSGVRKIDIIKSN